MYKIKVRAFVKDSISFKEFDLYNSKPALEERINRIDGTYIFNKERIYTVANAIAGIMRDYFFNKTSYPNTHENLNITFQYEEKFNKRVYIGFENWRPLTMAVVDFIEVWLFINLNSFYWI